MESIQGDKWLAEYAKWVRSNESDLGGSIGGVASSAAASASWINPVNWIAPGASSSSSSSSAAAPSKPPMYLRLNPHHLYYLLIRAEAAGILVGPLDVKAPSASRPSSYFAFVPRDSAGAHKVWNKQMDDTMSVRSGISMGALSNFTIESTRSWWGAGAKEPASNPTKDIKYVYSALTKIPALHLGPPPPRLIRDFEDCPGELSVPIDCFKNVQSLIIEDIDPRTLLGWDRASMQLRSLTLKRSGLEDVSELMVDCVVNDARRRRGEKVKRRERRVHRPMPEEEEEGAASSAIAGVSKASPSRSLRASEDSASGVLAGGTTDSPPPPHLPVLSWHFLKHLSLADNSLTFLPSTPLYALVSLVSLDLSSNLLNAVPPSLAHVPTLLSLDVSGNLIDSVLGIPETLPNVRTLNLARNRLESLCGLERLKRLQRVDLRKNEVYNAGEVGRLAAVESAREIWIKGNPLIEELEDPRVEVYVEFAKEGREVGNVKIDGEGIGYFERQRVAARVPRAMGAARGATPAASEGGSEVESISASVANVAKEAAPVKAVRHRAGHHHAPQRSGVNREGTASMLGKPGPSVIRASSKDRANDGTDEIVAARRRNRRLVELDSADSAPAQTGNDEGEAEEALTDSDVVKRAALEGRTQEALGVAPAPANDAAQVAAPPPTRKSGRTSAERPRSILAPGGMSLSRKTGAAAALLTSRPSAAEEGVETKGEAEVASPTSPASPLSLAHEPTKLGPPTLTRRSTAGSTGHGGASGSSSSTVGRRAGRSMMLRRSTMEEGEALGSSPSSSSKTPLAADSASMTSGATASGEGEGAPAERDEDESSPKSRIRVGRRANASSIAARRSRWTTSMYSPSTNDALSTSGGSGGGGGGTSAGTTTTTTTMVNPSQQQPPQRGEAPQRLDDFRRRIEALRGDVGDDWLRVLARGESVYVPREEDEDEGGE